MSLWLPSLFFSSFNYNCMTSFILSNSSLWVGSFCLPNNFSDNCLLSFCCQYSVCLILGPYQNGSCRAWDSSGFLFLSATTAEFLSWIPSCSSSFMGVNGRGLDSQFTWELMCWVSYYQTATNNECAFQVIFLSIQCFLSMPRKLSTSYTFELTEI